MALCNLDFLLNIGSATVYMGVHVYAQTVVYQEQTSSIVASNIPKILVSLITMVTIQCLLGKLWVLLQQSDIIRSLNVSFVDNLEEGMIIMRNGSLEEIKVINKAAA